MSLTSSFTLCFAVVILTLRSCGVRLRRTAEPGQMDDLSERLVIAVKASTGTSATRT